ncbi:hypothetical protein CYMTET_49191 [Cymbomonas tetramitiformis]|uniref:Uncharacterized protein n=1 Tax=Cymbomonas tetramitiformis TaxID=36881 RepID=A0AAE0BRZ0_9CHLO|nr:hypothetical protein CYMTET_49191 [Cymbomonas tetramitiformis]
MENGDSEDENFVGGSRKRSRESKPVTVKQEPKAEPESEENNEESELDSEDEAPLNKRKAIAKKSPVNKAPTTKSPKPNAVNENNNKYHAQVWRVAGNWAGRGGGDLGGDGWRALGRGGWRGFGRGRVAGFVSGEKRTRESAQPVGEEVLHGIPANDIHACAFDVPQDGFASLWSLTLN